MVGQDLRILCSTAILYFKRNSSSKTKMFKWKAVSLLTCQWVKTNLWKFSSVASRCVKMSSAAATDPASFIAGSKLKISWFKLAKKLSWTSESFLSMFKAQSPAITQKSSLVFLAAIFVDRALDIIFVPRLLRRFDDLSHNSLSPTFKGPKRKQYKTKLFSFFRAKRRFSPMGQPNVNKNSAAV